MIIVARPQGFDVEDSGNFSQFHVDARGMSAQDLADLADRHPDTVARSEPDHLWIRISYLTGHADAANTPEWRDGFEGMTRFATQHGWVDEQVRAIRAHIQDQLPPG